MVEGMDLELEYLEVLFFTKESYWRPRGCCVGYGELRDA